LFIRSCSLIAIDGPQGSGKTTLVHALAAHLRERSIRVAASGEATRASVYFEDALLRGDPLDINVELHILGSLVKAEHEAARHHELVICDRSALNIAAYSQLLVGGGGPESNSLLEAISRFCTSYGALYDLVAYLEDCYDLAFDSDPFRPLTTGKSGVASPVEADRALREAYERARIKVCLAPMGMTISEKVGWLASQLVQRDIIRATG
jgi:nicotinamide riboside kinase